MNRFKTHRSPIVGSAKLKIYKPSFVCLTYLERCTMGRNIWVCSVTNFTPSELVSPYKVCLPLRTGRLQFQIAIASSLPHSTVLEAFFKNSFFSYFYFLVDDIFLVTFSLFWWVMSTEFINVTFNFTFKSSGHILTKPIYSIQFILDICWGRNTFVRSIRPKLGLTLSTKGIVPHRY
jgi:hypothetical protein